MSGESLAYLGGMLLGLMQLYLAYRLKQQDNAREAAKVEQEAAAAKVKEEALTAARAVEAKVDDAAAKASVALGEIHVLVNNRMSEALERVAALEQKLGLHSGEQIPGPPTITTRTDPEPEPPAEPAPPPRRRRKPKA